jgi:dTDP-4-amino-4,6-dideoxygalactose transaminase
MKRIDAFIKRRHQLAERYDQLLAHLPVTLPWQHPDAASALHLYVIQIDEASGKSRQFVFEQLRQRGIGVQVHYIPVHTQPYYQALGFRPGAFPESEAYYERAISLPLFYDLTNEQQDTVVQALTEILA